MSGYNDGDPLSADDHSFLSDNVFNYHPDKTVKMGAGIDHFTVDKHASYQNTKFFFVVSTDGSKQDFSSCKCLESFIRGKCPNLADDFTGKYFKKPRSRGTGNAVLLQFWKKIGTKIRQFTPVTLHGVLED